MVNCFKTFHKISDRSNKMHFVYFVESIPVELSGRVQILESGDLLISNVRESDAGLYTCSRANEAGAVTGEAYLGVMGKKISKITCVCIEFQGNIIN